MNDSTNEELDAIRLVAGTTNNRMLLRSFIWQFAILSISIFILAIPATFVTIYSEYHSGLNDVGPNYNFLPIETFSYILISGLLLLLSWVIVGIITKFRPGFWVKLVPNLTRDNLNGTIGYRISLRAQLNHKELPDIDKFIVIISIDDRISRLRARNSIILGAISLSLAAAVLVVIYAGQLTSYDVSAISETDRLKSELHSASNTLAQLGHFQELLSQPSIDKTVDPKGAETRGNDYYDTSRSLFSAGLIVPKDVPAAAAMVAVQQKWIEALDTLYKESWDEELKSYASDKSSNQWRYLIATAITRIGVILIIVFLVQIFLGLYRYNIDC
jgi:hypothetical protein